MTQELVRDELDEWVAEHMDEFVMEFCFRDGEKKLLVISEG